MIKRKDLLKKALEDPEYCKVLIAKLKQSNEGTPATITKATMEFEKALFSAEKSGKNLSKLFKKHPVESKDKDRGRGVVAERQLKEILKSLKKWREDNSLIWGVYGNSPQYRKAMSRTASKPLYGHKNQATAYVVDDYPYGFRARTQIRYWIEFKKNRGFRFVSQTLNPKTDRWNKPKASTYTLFGLNMFLDNQGHVHSEGVSEYTEASDVLKFVSKFPKSDFSVLKPFAVKKVAFLTDIISGKTFFTVNGVKAERTEKDLKRDNQSLEMWKRILQIVK